MDSREGLGAGTLQQKKLSQQAKSNVTDVGTHHYPEHIVKISEKLAYVKSAMLDQ